MVRPLLKHEYEKRTPLEDTDATISWDNVNDVSVFTRLPRETVTGVGKDEHIGRRENSEWRAAGVSTIVAGSALGGSVYAFGVTSTLIGAGVVVGGLALLVNWAVGNTYEL